MSCKMPYVYILIISKLCGGQFKLLVKPVSRPPEFFNCVFPKLSLILKVNDLKYVASLKQKNLTSYLMSKSFRVH